MFDITADFAELERALTDIPRKQLPFAMARAINDAAADVKLAEERQLERMLDRPTPFTKRGIYVRRANKAGLTAEVGVKPVQRRYLDLQARGGVRRPKRRALVIGVGLRRNKYGNIAKGAVRRAEGGGRTFVVRPSSKSSLPPGVYRRTGRGGRGGLKMLAAFEPSARYSARLPYQATAFRTAKAVIEGHLNRRIKEAIATAR